MFDFYKYNVKHLIINVTSMHLECSGVSGFSSSQNSKTKILELKGTQENQIKRFSKFEEVETVVLHQKVGKAFLEQIF